MTAPQPLAPNRPPAPDERLERKLAFIVEVDKLKEVLRKARLLAGGRNENSAEHSWHVALMAMVLADYAAEAVDLLHVLRMLLVHDIVEIDAGDTFAFGDQSDKAAAETEAAARLFGLLPDEQRAEYEGLWREFEARTTPAARFANAMDRLMPALHNYYGGGGTWREFNVTWSAVERRLSPIGEGAPHLWEWLRARLEEARARGDING